VSGPYELRALASINFEFKIRITLSVAFTGSPSPRHQSGSLAQKENFALQSWSSSCIPIINYLLDLPTATQHFRPAQAKITLRPMQDSVTSHTSSDM
jgi:hypothetical protein